MSMSFERDSITNQDGAIGASAGNIWAVISTENQSSAKSMPEVATHNNVADSLPTMVAVELTAGEQHTQLEEERTVEISANAIADKIATNRGLGNAAIRRNLSGEMQIHRGNLQGLVDSVNRRFEANNQNYYMGVSSENRIVLYSPTGLQTLDLPPR